MSAQSMGLRWRVLADCDAGLPTKQEALKFGARCSMTLDLNPIKLALSKIKQALRSLSLRLGNGD